MDKLKIILLFLSIIIFSVSCQKKVDEVKVNSIRVAYMPDFSGTSSVAIAQEKGYFTDENLDVTLVKFLDGPSEVNSMLTGNIHFAYIGHGAHSLAIQGKVNVLFPNGLSKSEQIIVRKSSGINRIADLPGKKVATIFGTSSEILLDLALNKVGINREDLNVIDMGGNNIVTAMNDKTIDAVSVHAPYTFEILNMLGDEVQSIATIMDYSDDGAFPSSWIVTPEYMNNNNDIVNRFSRAILKAMDYRSANMDEAIEIVSRFNNENVDDVVLEKDTAEWFSGADIKRMYADGSASGLYRAQQNIFIYTKAISGQVNINKYVQIKYMNDNVFNQ